ncbi:MAG: hypothetical protein ACR2OC_00875 [Solirubrobacterales bacterium]
MKSGPNARSVVRRALRTIRRHWKALLVVGAFIFIPLGFLDVANEHVGDVDIEDLSEARFLAILGVAFSGTVTALLGEIFFAGVVAAAVQETQGGRAPTVRELVRSLPFLTLIAIDVLFVIGLGLTSLLLIVPGVLFFGYFALTAPLAKIEHLGIRAAFSRSRRLVRGHLLLVLGILMPVAIGGEVLGGLLAAGVDDLLGETFLSESLAATLIEFITTPLWAFSAVSLTFELLEHEGEAPAPTSTSP